MRRLVTAVTAAVVLHSNVMAQNGAPAAAPSVTAMPTASGTTTDAPTITDEGTTVPTYVVPLPPTSAAPVAVAPVAVAAVTAGPTVSATDPETDAPTIDAAATPPPVQEQTVVVVVQDEPNVVIKAAEDQERWMDATTVVVDVDLSPFAYHFVLPWATTDHDGGDLSKAADRTIGLIRAPLTAITQEFVWESLRIQVADFDVSYFEARDNYDPFDVALAELVRNLVSVNLTCTLYHPYMNGRRRLSIASDAAATPHTVPAASTTRVHQGPTDHLEVYAMFHGKGRFRIPPRFAKMFDFTQNDPSRIGNINATQTVHGWIRAGFVQDSTVLLETLTNDSLETSNPILLQITEMSVLTKNVDPLINPFTGQSHGSSSPRQRNMHPGWMFVTILLGLLLGIFLFWKIRVRRVARAKMAKYAYDLEQHENHSIYSGRPHLDAHDHDAREAAQDILRASNRYLVKHFGGQQQPIAPKTASNYSYFNAKTLWYQMMDSIHDRYRERRNQSASGKNTKHWISSPQAAADSADLTAPAYKDNPEEDDDEDSDEEEVSFDTPSVTSKSSQMPSIHDLPSFRNKSRVVSTEDAPNLVLSQNSGSVALQKSPRYYRDGLVRTPPAQAFLAAYAVPAPSLPYQETELGGDGSRRQPEWESHMSDLEQSLSFDSSVMSSGSTSSSRPPKPPGAARGRSNTVRGLADGGVQKRRHSSRSRRSQSTDRSETPQPTFSATSAAPSSNDQVLTMGLAAYVPEFS
jgi:hypothetical protein